MKPDTMKHSAHIWDGEAGSSRCIEIVHWEGDITPEELASVADQLSPVWQTVELHLDPAHPLHGNIYYLHRLTDDAYEEAEYLKRRAAFEKRYAGQRVWIHGYHFEDEHDDGSAEPFFYDHMFSTVFQTLAEVEALCDQHYGAGVWDEYSLYLDDKLPTPLPIDF